MTIQELIEEQRRRLVSGSRVERLAAALLIPGMLRERLNHLRDRQIGQLLLDEVWSKLNLLGPESTICLEGVDRLRGLKPGELDKRLSCPKCGNEMLLHYGIDEPDFFECVLLTCGYKWQVANDNVPGTESGEER